MIRALLKLTWLEIKIFVREPLGLFGTIGIPVLVFVVMTRILGANRHVGAAAAGLARQLVPAGADFDPDRA